MATEQRGLRAFSAEDLEDWRRHPVTAAYLEEVQEERQDKLEMLVQRAESGPVDMIRALGGALAMLDRLLELTTKKEKADGKD